MVQAVVRVSNLPDDALDAASVFHARGLGLVRRSMTPDADALVIVLPAAAHDHRGWRRALVQGLARSMAPVRVNALEGGNEESIAAALAWLEGASGVTGQLLKLADE